MGIRGGVADWTRRSGTRRFAAASHPACCRNPAYATRRLVRELGLLFAREQGVHAFDRGEVAVQDALHEGADRQFDAVLVGVAHDRVDGLDALDHLADFGDRIAEW